MYKFVNITWVGAVGSLVGWLLGVWEGRVVGQWVGECEGNVVGTCIGAEVISVNTNFWGEGEGIERKRGTQVSLSG